MSRIETPGIGRHRDYSRVFDADNFLVGDVDMGNQTMNRSGVAVIGCVVTHKSNTAHSAVALRNFCHRVSTGRPRVDLKSLEILFGFAGNPARGHGRQPLFI